MDRTESFTDMVRPWTLEDAVYASKALEELRPHHISYSVGLCGEGYGVVAFHYYAPWQDTTITNDIEAIRYICQKEK